MPRVVALFILKEGVTAQDYELWARNTDIPTVNGLRSIDQFSTHRAAISLQPIAWMMVFLKQTRSRRGPALRQHTGSYRCGLEEQSSRFS